MSILFTVVDRWGDEIRLSETRWNSYISSKHPELADHLTSVKQTLEDPDVVYEGTGAPDSKLFYTQGLIEDDPRFRNFWLAVVVRYTKEPASVRTSYVTPEIGGNVGQVLYLREGLGR